MESLSKQAILAEVERLAKHDAVTLDELKAAYAKGAPDKPEVTQPAPQQHGRVTNLTNALYMAGGAIVIVALAFTILQNWTNLDSFSRILVTIGIGAALTVGGWVRLSGTDRVNKDVLGNTLLIIGSFAFMLGVFVVADELNFDLRSGSVTMLFGLLTAAFMALYYFGMRSVTWLFFAIFTATSAVYSGTDWYISDVLNSISVPEHLFNYISATIGVAYILLSRWLKTRTVAHLLSPALFVLGNFFILTPFLVMAFMESLQRGEVFDLIYPLIVGGMVLLSAYWRMSRAVFIPVIFLAIYIFHICYEYFADELGGSVALLIAGALVIGLSYITTVLSKRYFKKP